MKAVIPRPGHALLHDDCDSSRKRTVDENEMYAFTVQGLINHPSWTLRRELTPEDVNVVSLARARLGLPAWLRRGSGGRVKAPSLFCNVKSKWFSPCVTCTCTKAKHSCWRRILDMSGVPYASGWRTMARGVRGVIRTVGHTWGLFNMSHVVSALRAALSKLTAKPT